MKLQEEIQKLKQALDDTSAKRVRLEDKLRQLHNQRPAHIAGAAIGDESERRKLTEVETAINETTRELSVAVEAQRELMFTVTVKALGLKRELATAALDSMPKLETRINSWLAKTAAELNTIRAQASAVFGADLDLERGVGFHVLKAPFDKLQPLLEQFFTEAVNTAFASVLAGETANIDLSRLLNALQALTLEAIPEAEQRAERRVGQERVEAQIAARKLDPARAVMV